jgi:hypothetical protein
MVNYLRFRLTEDANGYALRTPLFEVERSRAGSANDLAGKPWHMG